MPLRGSGDTSDRSGRGPGRPGECWSADPPASPACEDAADAEANEFEGVAVGKACGDEQDAAGEAVGLQLRHEGDGGLIANNGNC